MKLVKREPGAVKIFNGPRDPKWQRVERLAIAGCSGLEITGAMGINKDTLYNACKESFGMLWTEKKNEWRSHGNSKLREAQFNVALNEEHPKSADMLKFLGKNRLKQCEQSAVTIDIDFSKMSLPELRKMRALDIGVTVDEED